MNPLNPNVQHNRAVGNHHRSQGPKNKDDLKLQQIFENSRVRNTSNAPSTGVIRPGGGMSPAAVFTLALLASTVFPLSSGAPVTPRNEAGNGARNGSGNENNTRRSNHSGTTSNTTSSSAPIPSPAATLPQPLNPMTNVTAPHAPTPMPTPMPTPSAEGVRINFAPHSSVRSKRSADSTPKFDKAKTKCDSKQKVHCAEKMLKLTQNKDPNEANKAKEYLGTHADTLSSELTKNIEKKKTSGDSSRVEELEGIKGLVNEQKAGATASCHSINAETGNNNKYLPLDKCISPNMGRVNEGEDNEENTCTWSNKCSDTITVEFNGTQVDVQTRGTDSAASATNTVPCLQTGTTADGKKKFIKPKCDSDGTTRPKVTKKP